MKTKCFGNATKSYIHAYNAIYSTAKTNWPRLIKNPVIRLKIKILIKIDGVMTYAKRRW